MYNMFFKSLFIYFERECAHTHAQVGEGQRERAVSGVVVWTEDPKWAHADNREPNAGLGFMN